jgi:hypothetical protein
MAPLVKFYGLSPAEIRATSMEDIGHLLDYMKGAESA